MLTQIFIKGDGCQPEYTKIASQSFIFHPTGLPGIDYRSELYIGGEVSLMDYVYPIWSADIRDYSLGYTAGSLVGTVKADTAAMGIPLPINLVPNDTVTISGNAFFNNASLYINAGWEVSLIVGVYYFSCKEVTLEGARMFTFIPVSTAGFDEKGNACFNADVTLGSNFDFHDTRILVGYNIIATCPGECVTPEPDANVATVSYTLDIERPCQVIPSNFIIRNCCEGSITELVNIPGLVVGDFHVDNEGNCWEVMEQSNDVTNFTRTFTSNYATCLECQDDNGCPLNLMIKSCCVEGKELVTGSLPGLVVGDTFLDNYGLCWYVEDETPAPISEESITVVSIIEGGCETCTIANPCPNFYGIVSCCGQIEGYIAVPDILNVGDSFVDAQGQCWQVIQTDTGQLPTIYGIEVVTVYPYQGEGVEPTACDLCITANPCPTEYFITIKSCCDQDRVEVAEVPAEFMFFTEGTVFNDYWGICWEVLSFDTTGVATFEIWPWNDEEPSFSSYKDCRECLQMTGCIGAYNIKDCQTDIVYNNVVLKTEGPFPPSIGSFYVGIISSESFEDINSCFEVLSLGYPTYPLLIKGYLQNEYELCLDCLLQGKVLKKLEVTPCCGGPNEILETTIPWLNGIGSVQGVATSTVPGGPFALGCYTLVGLSLGTPTLYTDTFYDSFSGCENCLTKLNIIC